MMMRGRRAEQTVISIPCTQCVMPKCRNCGSFVTESYVKVFAPNGMSRPRVCPNCEDKTREKGGVREKRS
jgi:hypothetical protein